MATPATVPEHPPEGAPRKKLQRRWRGIIGGGSILVLGTFFFFSEFREPGAGWFSSMEAPRQSTWEIDSKPAPPWTPQAADTWDISCKWSISATDEPELSISSGVEQHSSSSVIALAPFIQADENNAATLPDGTVVSLSGILATTGLPDTAPLRYKITSATTAISAPLDVETASIARPNNLRRLQLSFNQTAPIQHISRDFFYYSALVFLHEQKTGYSF